MVSERKRNPRVQLRAEYIAGRRLAEGKDLGPIAKRKHSSKQELFRVSSTW